MIREQDVLALAPGVSVEGDRLSDAVRGASWPLNASGTFVLLRAGQPLGPTVAALADASGLTPEQARGDVLRFVWQLNALALVNVERTGSRIRQLHEWVVLAARLAPAGSIPGLLTRRRPIDTRTAVLGLLTGFRATLPRAALAAAVAAAGALHLALVAGGTALLVPLAAAIALGAGIAVHEGAHAAALAGVPSALVTRGRRTFVLHAEVPAGRRARVAAAGPGVTAVLGVLLAALGAAAVPALAPLGWPLAAHAVCLTVACSDGRVACGL